MPVLRELCFGSDENFENFDMPSRARNLPNLERVQITVGQFFDLIQLMRYAPKSKEINVDRFDEEVYLDDEI